MRVCVTLLAIACLACESRAAEHVDVKLLLQRVMPRSAHVMPLESVTSYRFKRDASTISKRELDDVMALGRDTTLEVVKTTGTVQGTQLVKMQEKFQGRTVLDGIVTIETDKTGHRVLDASGSVFRNIDRDLDSDNIRELEPDSALDACLELNGDGYLQYNVANVEVIPEILFDDDQTAYPAYFVQYLIVEDGDLRRPTCSIDARDGHVIETWDSVESCFECTATGTGGNVKLGKIRYGVLQRCLDVRRSEDGKTCYLENDFVRVVNLNNSKPSSLTLFTESPMEKEVASYDCFEADDEVNGGFSPLLDALFLGTVVGRMYRDWYDMSPIGEVITLQVHYGLNISNARWTGTSCLFGDGGEYYYPLVSLDIMSHEIAHGVTERNSNLYYYKQWGGINEAFSDMAGETAEAYLSDENDWVSGADITKTENYIRYYEHPEMDNRSISHVDNYTDPMNVHYSSGIFNRVFFALVQERGLPIKEVFRVFLHANLMYWHHMPTFVNAACDVMKAAYDVGQNGADFRAAFADVGIEACDVEDHVLGLKYGELYTGIKVSKAVSPSFMLGVAGEVAQSVTVNASSDTRNEKVYIVVSNSTWGAAEDEAGAVEVYAEGFQSVEFEVPTNESMHVSITLSSDSNELLSDVTLQTSYECAKEPPNEDFFIVWLKYCGLQLYVSDDESESEEEKESDDENDKASLF